MNTGTTSDSFEELLKFICQKPAFYLAPDRHGRCESLRNLYSFIVGFQVGQNSQDNTDVLDAFTFWVCHHYGVPDGAMNWLGHILHQAGDDDAAGFKLFAQHFDSYLKERAEIGPEAIKARFLSMLDETRRR